MSGIPDGQGVGRPAISNMKGRLLAIPTKVAPRMLKLSDAREAQAIIEQEVEQSLAELSAVDALCVPEGEESNEFGSPQECGEGEL